MTNTVFVKHLIDKVVSVCHASVSNEPENKRLKKREVLLIE